MLGSGVGKAAADVRWGVAGRMVVGWVLTLPAAALVAALIALVTQHGGNVGIILVAIVAVLALIGVWIASRKNAVTADNVNDVEHDVEHDVEVVDLLAPDPKVVNQ